MTRWILAAILALVGAWIAYGPIGRRRDDAHHAAGDLGRPVAPSPVVWGLGALRAGAYLCLLGLLFGAPAGAPEPLAPLPVLDVSASWRRADDGAAWRSAQDTLRALAGDTVLLAGDSVRAVSRGDAASAAPEDERSRLRPALDLATALGRAVVIVTDGEVDDPAALADLPAGSRVARLARAPRADLAVAHFETPPWATGGDTVDVHVTLAAGNAPVDTGVLLVRLDAADLARVSVQPLDTFASRRITVRVPVPRGAGPRTLSAIVQVANDAEARNDTLSAVVEVTDRPRVVFVSTVPDLDVREVLRVLRGTVMLPARAYLRVAPGIWREEGSFAAVAEAEVQQRAREAGLLVLHGDSAWSGIAAARRGAMVLWTPAPPPPPPRAGELSRPVEWFVHRAPPSPLSAVLDGLPFDSLAPLDIGAPVAGGVPLLEARAGRAGTPRVVAAVTSTAGARRLRVSGSGFAAWALRGGRSGDAFTAFWGAIFDWMAASEGSGEGVRLADGIVRAGEPLRWRRGGTADSVATVVLTMAGRAPDSLAVRFADAQEVVETPSVEAGVYTVQTAGGTRRLVVNPSREWVPRPPAVIPEVQRAGAVLSVSRPLLERNWPFVLALVLLCVEWLARRTVGLR